MANPAEHLLQQADAAIDWYWSFGRQRTGDYAILKGEWLDYIYRIRERGRAMLRAETAGKACMALWGPSQTGKSTLLSGYLDDPKDDFGHFSALKWSDAEPVRFVVGDNKSSDVIVLNPFNFGSDASGCVSRFILRDAVEDPAHPVEIILATVPQLLHALAVGYESECKMANAQGDSVKWDNDSFKALLDRQKPAGPMQRAAFEALQQLGETLDLLILSNLSRYQNLALAWETLRSKMLSTEALLGSVEAVERFAFELLWDGWSSLTQTYQALAAKRRELAQQFGSRSLRASFRTAAILLDIDSFKKCEDKPETRQKVGSILLNLTADAVTLGQQGGQPLVRDAGDFGNFQALVWELRIPLRRDVLQQRAPLLAAFFEKADLLDFPGVANSFGNAEKPDNAAVAASPVIALTEVLKRGKTASIVVTSARNLDIDGFSLLMRLGKFPAQPLQLVSGVRSWLESFGQAWPPRSRVMPLNLITTFSATLVNQVITAGVRDGLQGCFDQLKSLGHLADPKVVTTLATTYPQFPEGAFFGTPEQQQPAVDAIVQDRAFGERFGDSEETFREMYANGGTDYVFRTLTSQAAASRRMALIDERLAEAANHLQQLLQQQAPSENAAKDERDRALDEWTQAIAAKLKEAPGANEEIDSATRLSRYLREFLNIDPDELDDIPQNAVRLKHNVRAFIEKQFRAWQARRGEFTHLNHIGLSQSLQATRMLSYLIDASELGVVESFFRENLGHLNSRQEAKHARRFLAVQMSNVLLDRRRLNSGTHRPVSDGQNSVRNILEALAAGEEENHPEPEQSPHYHTTIYPFLQRLRQIKDQHVGARPAQAGDAELLEIVRLS